MERIDEIRQSITAEYANNEQVIAFANKAGCDYIPYLLSEVDRLQSQLSESRRREKAAVEDIADFIVEYADCLKIAIDTKDRNYLEILIRQWRGPQSEEGEEHE